MRTLTPLPIFLMILVKKDKNPHGMMKRRSVIRDANSLIGKVLIRILFATRRMPVRF